MPQSTLTTDKCHRNSLTHLIYSHHVTKIHTNWPVKQKNLDSSVLKIWICNWSHAWLSVNYHANYVLFISLVFLIDCPAVNHRKVNLYHNIRIYILNIYFMSAHYRVSSNSTFEIREYSSCLVLLFRWILLKIYQSLKKLPGNFSSMMTIIRDYLISERWSLI